MVKIDCHGVLYGRGALCLRSKLRLRPKRTWAIV